MNDSRPLIYHKIGHSLSNMSLIMACHNNTRNVGLAAVLFPLLVLSIAGCGIEGTEGEDYLASWDAMNHVSDVTDSTVHDTARDIVIGDIPKDICTPYCDHKECGDDGCGGRCGTCFFGECSDGTCTCIPDCTDRKCGDDGCGETCGTCGYGECIDGQCECEPDCDDHLCGNDGCGGLCGESCEDNQVCIGWPISNDPKMGWERVCKDVPYGWCDYWCKCYDCPDTQDGPWMHSLIENCYGQAHAGVECEQLCYSYYACRGGNAVVVLFDEPDNTCEQDCSNLECGLDPDCDLSCGRCSTGQSCIAGKCI